jgi:hypothetical protein
MKIFISVLILSLNLLMFVGGAEAQVKQSQLGIRLGNRSVGLMARFYTRNSNGAVENFLMLDHGCRGFSLASIYEQHHVIPSVKGLSFYTGAGMHVGYQSAVDNTGDLSDIAQEFNDQGKMSAPGQPSVMYWGIDAIGGIYYHFPNSAIHISADIKPGMSLTKNSLEIFNSAIKLGVDL